MMRTKIGKYYRKYSRLSELASSIEASCMALSGGGAFFSRCLFRNLWGVPPWIAFGIPWAPWSNVVDLLEDFRSKFAPKFKAYRAAICTNHTFKKKKQGFTNNFTNNQFKRIIVYFCCLSQPRKFETPFWFFEIGSAELPKG